MNARLQSLFAKLRHRRNRAPAGGGDGDGPVAATAAKGWPAAPRAWLGGALVLGLLGAGAYYTYTHPPLAAIERGEIGLRINRWTGRIEELYEGTHWHLPGIHDLRRLSLRERVFRAEEGESAQGAAPFQTVEGLSIGLEVAVRYALERNELLHIAQNLPRDLDAELIAPTVRGVLYQTMAQHTVREIYSSKREAIRQSVEEELRRRFTPDGIKLVEVLIGKIDLPPDYKAGMEQLLAEELASEKMRYTLELKDKQVKQTELEAQAEKVRREKRAEASALEQVIAAQAQAEAMKHVLPFKQKQIEQRQLEAEAEKITRVKHAEAASQARQIEATGEAESRRKLADAEAYRQERLGQIASAQLARDGEVISRNPLLIQKTLADKLSDKISVIIAPAPTDGGFIGSHLIGQLKSGK